MSDEFKKRFNRARHDYGFHHGHNARGIAPSYIGADSLPQAVNDLHWALHGVQGNMDLLDSRMTEFEGNISDIADGMKDDVVKSLGNTIIESNTPITNKSGYLSSLMTTRSRIFSDSFGPERIMNPVDRIRGFTENYSWIQYSQKSTDCEGNYDKVIDFTYVSTHMNDDSQQPRMVSKAKILVPNAGLIKRFHISQNVNNILLYYLVSQPIPTSTGVGYSGSIRKLEYDKFGEFVSEGSVSVNHTPLIMLGAFSADVNNEKDFIQYISTDYKLYQNYNDTDLLIGQLPPEIIDLIDPVNDIFSDSKQVFIPFYNNDGTIKFPMKSFTIIDSMDGSDVKEKFSILELNEESELFNSMVSISPRTETKLIKTFSENEVRTNEGGVFLESYDYSTEYRPTVNGSHIFLLSSTEEIYEVDKFSSSIYDYHTVDGVSEFSLKRERDYTEFGKITFSGELSKMFPEIKQDFGIGDDVPFTLEFDDSKETETLTIHLREPLILTRSIRNYQVDNRRGFTVLHNSDYVLDVADLDVLSVYEDLDFVIESKRAKRSYISKHPNYNSDYVVPKYMRYKVVDSSVSEKADGVTRISYIDEISNVDLTFNTKTKSVMGVTKHNENYTSVYMGNDRKLSPLTNPNLLSKNTDNDVVYLEGNYSHEDKPYGVSEYTLLNETTGNKVVQRLLTSDDVLHNSKSKPSNIVTNVSRVVTVPADRTEYNNYLQELERQKSTYNTERNRIIDSNREKQLRNDAKRKKYEEDKRNTPVGDSTSGSNVLVDNGSMAIMGNPGSPGANYYRNISVGVRNTVDAVRLQRNLSIENTVTTINPPETGVFDVGNDVFRVNKIATTVDGRNVNAIADILNATPLQKTLIESGTTLKTQGPSKGTSEIRYRFVDDNDTPINIVGSMIFSDLDFGQKVSVKFSGDTIIYNDPASQLREEGDLYVSNTSSDYNYAEDWPKGSLVVGGYGNSITIRFVAPSNYEYSVFNKVHSTSIVTYEPVAEPTYEKLGSVPAEWTDSMFTGRVVAVPKDTARTETTTQTTKTSAKYTESSDGLGFPGDGVVFVRSIYYNKVGEWYGSGYIKELKYLGIPGRYFLDEAHSGDFFRSVTPTHRVFGNIVSRDIHVSGTLTNLTSVSYTITNDIGLSMTYHNIAIREDRTDNVGFTSKPYRLMYDKWIPGKYVGNDDYPLGPDHDSVTKELLNRVKTLENTVSNLITKLIESGLWDPNSGDIQDASSTDDKNLDNRSKLRGGMKRGVNIAYGNINLFGQDPDGNYFIRTNNGSTENDLLGGI